MDMSERYYIEGKRYSPDKSIVLCSYDWIGDTTTLYQSPKGTLFIVEKSDCAETAVKILTKAEALEFMDLHPVGIITENYNAVFGEPEPG